MEGERLYAPREFARLIGRSVATLQRWDRDGILQAYRSPTNRRYYTHTQYLQYRGLLPAEKGGDGRHAPVQEDSACGACRRTGLLWRRRDLFNVPSQRSYRQGDTQCFLLLLCSTYALPRGQSCLLCLSELAEAGDVRGCAWRAAGTAGRLPRSGR